MIKLKRLSEQPILMPKKEHVWEAATVFNCGAIYHNGLVHMIYRATDITSNGTEGKYINSFGYAVSKDGLHFNRLEQPILINDVEQELRGPEDPRIVYMDGLFYMMYTGYGGRFDGDYRICLATSPNLISWQRHGVMLDESNKDAALFPEKINGRYAMLHRRAPDIWIAYSEDLKQWTDHQVLMQVDPHSEWEAQKIGAAGPPIQTEDGWLLIYHGVSEDGRYSLGITLLDHNDPTKILHRQTDPILEPELEWETNGYVPNVVFSCGQALIGDDLFVYYGGADTVLGVAHIRLSSIKF